MDRCTGCGASLYAGDEWCLQCLTPVAAPAATPEAPVAEPVTAEPVAVSAGPVAAPAPPAWSVPQEPAPPPPPYAPPPYAPPAPQPGWGRPEPYASPQPAPYAPLPPATPPDPWAKATTEGWSAATGGSGSGGAGSFTGSFTATATATDTTNGSSVGPWVPPREGLAPGAGIGFTVAGILGLGLLVQVVLYVMAATDTAELAGIVRKGQLVIVAYYGVVLWWVVAKARAVGFEPRWKKGPVHEGVVFGLVAGILTCTVVVMATKALYGEIKTGGLFEFADVNVVSVGIVLLISVVCAPVVEELLFRGLIIEAMRPKGLRWGIPVSAFLFALWHWNGQLLYYSVMGALLAAVFWKWGLFSSMACHFAFNGTLTLLTLVFILGPGETVTGAGVRLEVPGGWDSANALEMGEVRRVEPLAIAAAVGPGAAELFVAKETAPIPGGWSADFLLMALNSLPETEGPYRFKKESLRPVEYPAGRAAHIEIELQGREGWMVVFFRGDDLYHFVLTPHGSNRAKNDFEKMLKTVQLP